MYPVPKLQAGMKSPGTSFNVRSFLDEEEAWLPQPQRANSPSTTTEGWENPNQKELRSCQPQRGDERDCS